MYRSEKNGKKYLGSNIEFLMTEKSLTKTELARKSKIHFSDLNKYNR